MMFSSNRSSHSKGGYVKKYTGQGLSTQSIISVKSTISQRGRGSVVTKEMMIAKKIQELFNEQDLKMTNSIRKTIFDDDLHIYKKFRMDFEQRLQELHKERSKLLRRKKVTKERDKLLRENTISKVHIISTILKKTYLYYKALYFESDQMRMVELMDNLYPERMKNRKPPPIRHDGKVDFFSVTKRLLMHKKKEKEKFMEELRAIDQEKEAVMEEVNLNSSAVAGPKYRHITATQQKDKDLDLPSNDQETEKESNSLTPKSALQDDKSDSKENQDPQANKEAKDPKDEGDKDSEKSKSKPKRTLSRSDSITDETSSQKGKIKKKWKRSMSKLFKVKTAAKPKKDPRQMYIKQLCKFIDSPFVADRKFAINQVLQLSRDDLPNNVEVLDAIYYEHIQPILLDSSDEHAIHQSFEILGYILDSEFHRNKLAKENYIKEIFTKMEQIADRFNSAPPTPAEESRMGKASFKEPSDPSSPAEKTERKSEKSPKKSLMKDKDYHFKIRILEKLTWLTSLMSLHQSDFLKEISDLNILRLILKLTDERFPYHIRLNSILALSLLTVYDDLFEQMIQYGVIDMILKLCMDTHQDMLLRQYATLAVVHFALNKKSIDLLIEKGVMKLFETFKLDTVDETVHKFSEETQHSDYPNQNAVLQTNISWIFLALCNNGISGRQMLLQGITRDMFLVACNPLYQQIRYLVITSFAVLGKSFETFPESSGSEEQVIKDLAISSQHLTFQRSTEVIIDILLRFTVSADLRFQKAAYRSLQDFVMSSNKKYLSDFSAIIQAFLNGCISEDKDIQIVCADAISFLVTHRIVYRQHDIEEETLDEEEMEDELVRIFTAPKENVLDAIMILSGSEHNFIRATAFSTLSSLSTFSSKYKTVMCQIQRDIEIPSDLAPSERSVSSQSSNDHPYHEYIKRRLEAAKRSFYSKFKTESIESHFSGVYSLLRLAQEPNETEILEAIASYTDFIDFVQEIQETVREKVIQVQQPINRKSDKDSSISYEESSLSSQILLEDEDTRRLEEIALNEKFYLDVFLALKHCDNPEVIGQLLKIIYFYSKQDEYTKFLGIKLEQLNKNLVRCPRISKQCRCIHCTASKTLLFCKEQVINPSTILWLLEILQKQSKSMQSKYLCCLCAVTLLSIVDKNDIAIGYQEQAIIKMFNRVLQNIEVFAENSASKKNESQSSASNFHTPNNQRRSKHAISRTRISRQGSSAFNILNTTKDDNDDEESSDSLSDDSSSSSSNSSDHGSIHSRLRKSIMKDLGNNLSIKQTKTRSSVQGGMDSYDSDRIKVKTHDSDSSKLNQKRMTQVAIKPPGDLSKSSLMSDANFDDIIVEAPADSRDQHIQAFQSYIDQRVSNISSTEPSKGAPLEDRKATNSSKQTEEHPSLFTIPGLGSPTFDIRGQILEQIEENELESREMSRRVSKTTLELPSAHFGSDKKLKRLSKRMGSDRDVSPVVEAKEEAEEGLLESKSMIKNSETSKTSSDQSSLTSLSKDSGTTVQESRNGPSPVRLKGASLLEASLSSQSPDSKSKRTQVNLQNPMEPGSASSIKHASGDNSTKKLKRQQSRNSTSSPAKNLPRQSLLLNHSPEKRRGFVNTAQIKSPLKLFTGKMNFKEFSELKRQVARTKSGENSFPMTRGRRKTVVEIQKPRGPLNMVEMNKEPDLLGNHSIDDDFNNINDILEKIFHLRGEASTRTSQQMFDQQKNIELYLRDSLIKAFMIIFTNEQSQHLLLNYDLIDIAFNCLQSSQDITLEAQRNVARLASMIFKFPKVLKKLLIPENQDVIEGMSELIDFINQSDYQFKVFIKNLVDSYQNEESSKVRRFKMKIQTLKFMLSATSLVSIHQGFVDNKDHSFRVLQSIVTLLNCPCILICLEPTDLFNIANIVNNILKFSEVNAEYFYEHQGTHHIMHFLLEGLNYLGKDAFKQLGISSSSKLTQIRSVISIMFKKVKVLSAQRTLLNSDSMDKLSEDESEEEGGLSLDDKMYNVSLSIFADQAKIPSVVKQFLKDAWLVDSMLKLTKQFLEATSCWALFTTECETREELLQMVLHPEKFVRENNESDAQTDKPKRARTPQLKISQISRDEVNKFTKAQHSKKDLNSHLKIEEDFKITERFDESEEEAEITPQVSSRKNGARRRREISSRNLGSLATFQQKQSDLSLLKPDSAAVEQVEVIEVEAPDKGDVEQLNKDFSQYSHILEVRISVLSISFCFLQEGMKDKEPQIVQSMVKALVYDAKMVDTLIEDLQLVAFKVNSIIDEQKQKDQDNIQQLYESCFNVISCVTRQTNNHKSLLDQRSLLEQLQQTTPEEDEARLTEDQQHQLQAYYESIFWQIVDYLKAFKTDWEATLFLLKREALIGGLVHFIRVVKLPTLRMTMFYLLADMLIDLLLREDIQALLRRLKLRNVRTRPEAFTPECIGSLNLVTTLITHLFVAAEAIDQREAEEKAVSGVEEEEESESESESEKDDEEGKFKDKVVWLVETLKIEPFLSSGGRV